MQELSNFKSSLHFLFTDIDDTLTEDGLLQPEAFEALWKLNKKQIQVIPVTGRPAGWCELIARQWPVAGVIGENGGFYFRYTQKKMKRFFVFDERTQRLHRQKLEALQNEILQEVPGCAIASDQFCRLMDLAIDFCEDVPALPKSKVAKIVDIFKSHGAQAKVSSIHVNGWFGDYDKLSMSLQFMQSEFGIGADELKKRAGFVGDSPNDEPMFAAFPASFAVANIKNFLSEINHHPRYVASLPGGRGFAQIAEQILKNSNSI